MYLYLVCRSIIDSIFIYQVILRVAGGLFYELLSENGYDRLLGKIVLQNITEAFVGKIVFGQKS